MSFRPSPQLLYARTFRGPAPSIVASGRLEAIASASQQATSSPAIAMRTTPCTPIKVKRFASFAHRSDGATRAPFTWRSTSARSVAIAPAAAGR